MRTKSPNLNLTTARHRSKSTDMKIIPASSVTIRVDWWLNPLRLSVAAVSLLLALTAAAQYAIPWHSIDGGGATAPSTGGVYALSGTIGQVDAGRVARRNDHYRLESGFWGIAVQQAGFPSLSVTQQSTNAVLSWITPETGFIVQFTTNLTPSTVWTDLGPATSTNGTTNAVAVPFDDAERAFFRLRRP